MIQGFELKKNLLIVMVRASTGELMSRPEAAVRNGYCKHGFPSLLCVSCLAQPPCVHNLPTGSCFQCRMLSTAVVPASATVAELPAKLDKEIRMLAALCYGEGSTNNVFEEMAALANVYVRQAKARKKKSVSDLVLSEPTYSYVVGDGNKRYKMSSKSSTACALALTLWALPARSAERVFESWDDFYRAMENK